MRHEENTEKKEVSRWMLGLLVLRPLDHSKPRIPASWKHDFERLHKYLEMNDTWNSREQAKIYILTNRNVVKKHTCL